MKKANTDLFTGYHVWEDAPKGFKPICEVSAAFVQIDSRILLLQSAALKQEKGLWGIPGGKLEEGEEPLIALVREIFEETGLLLIPSDVTKIHTLYMEKFQIPFILHLFEAQVKTLPPITLSNEHTAYLWIPMDEIHLLPIMNGTLEFLDYYRRKKPC